LTGIELGGALKNVFAIAAGVILWKTPYSAGFNCHGHLTIGQQRTIGTTTKARNELIRAGLWNLNGDDATIYIHDWADHNSKRDARRQADRIRKKQERAKPKRPPDSAQDAPQELPMDEKQDTLRTERGQNVGPAHVEGSEGSDIDQDQPTNHVVELPTTPVVGREPENGIDQDQDLAGLLTKAAPEDIPF